MSKNKNKKSQPHSYWLAISTEFKVTRKLKTYEPPDICNKLDGIWFSLGKKRWEEYRVGEMVKTEDVPGRVIETLKRIA